jgi:hypothetical protein
LCSEERKSELKRKIWNKIKKENNNERGNVHHIEVNK